MGAVVAVCVCLYRARHDVSLYAQRTKHGGGKSTSPGMTSRKGVGLVFDDFADFLNEARPQNFIPFLIKVRSVLLAYHLCEWSVDVSPLNEVFGSQEGLEVLRVCFSALFDELLDKLLAGFKLSSSKFFLGNADLMGRKPLFRLQFAQPLKERVQ